MRASLLLTFFFFNDTATTEIYTLSLHDALPILDARGGRGWKAGDMPNRLVESTSPYLLQHADNPVEWWQWGPEDRKSTRLNSSHQIISYAVFCFKKKNIKPTNPLYNHIRQLLTT